MGVHPGGYINNISNVRASLPKLSSTACVCMSATLRSPRRHTSSLPVSSCAPESGVRIALPFGKLLQKSCTVFTLLGAYCYYAELDVASDHYMAAVQSPSCAGIASQAVWPFGVDYGRQTEEKPYRCLPLSSQPQAAAKTRAKYPNLSVLYDSAAFTIHLTWRGPRSCISLSTRAGGAFLKTCPVIFFCAKETFPSEDHGVWGAA